MSKYPVYDEKQKLRYTYHHREIVLTADKKLMKGGKVRLIDSTPTDPLISNLAYELQQQKPMLHPEVLGGTSSEEEHHDLKGFLTGLCGVQIVGIAEVCRETLLSKILTTSPRPGQAVLLDYTKYCQKHLGAEIGTGKEAWVLTKRGDIRSAKEVFFPAEFHPPHDWESQQQFVSGLNFLSPEYVSDCQTAEEFAAWRDFFNRLGVKETPDSGVEDFAINFAIEKLQTRFRNIVPVEKRNYGYDLQAKDDHGNLVHIEVKGNSDGGAEELTGNETVAARKHKKAFFLCIVSDVPDRPKSYLIPDPNSVGEKDKLIFHEYCWREYPLDDSLA